MFGEVGTAGMWNTAYDHVGLNQPYSMFAVGDLKWASRKPRDYRPGRDEVRDHLASSIDAVRKTVSLSTRVVGGGKTGMDMVLAVLAENAQREVSLTNGHWRLWLWSYRCSESGRSSTRSQRPAEHHGS